MGVTVLGDRDAGHVLHHEVGTTLGSRSRIEHLCDRGMVHHGERLAFGLEAGDDLLRVHPRLDDLHRDLAANGFQLVRDPDFTHAAFADRLDESIWADAVALWRVRRPEARVGRNGEGVLEPTTRLAGSTPRHASLLRMSLLPEGNLVANEVQTSQHGCEPGIQLERKAR